jgi:hypothetical protein
MRVYAFLRRFKISFYGQRHDKVTRALYLVVNLASPPALRMVSQAR